MTPLVIGMLGCGTVGTGVARILREHGTEIEARLGRPLVLGPIAVRDIHRERAPEIPTDNLTTNPDDVLHDPNVQIIVEVIGGMEPARGLILEAIDAGKHVITANKALLAEHGAELFERADLRGVDIAFEASVGGGIPIIRSLREALASDRIQSIHGIINGTSNFLLTALSEGSGSYEEVLAEAQRLGYAEADPTMDVEGIDAAQKLSILLSLAFGTHVGWKEITTRGLSTLDALDFELADRFGFRIKPLAIAHATEAGIEARVEPTLLPKDSLLASVNDVFNAVFLTSHALGPTMLTGQGAGMMPTAVSVVSDIIEVARSIGQGTSGRLPHLAFRRESTREQISSDDAVSEHFLRFTVADSPGTLAHISQALADEGVSIRQVLQTADRKGDSATVVLLTHRSTHGAVLNALNVLDKNDLTLGPTRWLRIARPGDTEECTRD